MTPPDGQKQHHHASTSANDERNQGRFQAKVAPILS